MNLKEVQRVLLRMFALGLKNPDDRYTVEIIGGPGIGKTNIVEQTVVKLAQILKAPVGFHPFHLTTIEGVEARGAMMGVPKNHDDGTKTLDLYQSRPPVMPPEDAEKYGVVFLDERGQADHDVIKPMARFVDEKRIGNYHLPDGWTIWSASNRLSDRSGVKKELMFFVNRVIFINVEPDVNVWAEWAEKNGVHPMGIAYAKTMPGQVFHGTVPDHSGPFATPRSLVRMLKAIKAMDTNPDHMSLPLDDHVALELAQGAIGEGAAAEFFQFARIGDELPRIEEIISDPMTTKIPNRPDAAMVAMQLCIHHASPKAIENALAIFKYVTRLPKEFQVRAVRSIIEKTNGLILETDDADFSKWIASNNKLIMAATGSK